MMENQPPLTSPDGFSNGNPPERGPLPLYPRDSTQVNIKEDIKEEEDDVMEEAEFRKDHTYKENDQGEELKVIKVEDKEEEERLVSGDQQSMEEGEMIMESKQEESSLHLDTRPFHTCGPLPGEKRQCLERRDSAWREETVKMARDVSHERLIQLVHVRPALWDKRSAEYSDRNTISVKWEDIFKEVTPNWLSLSSKQRRIRGDKIITRWRSLRDRYRRELKEEAKESRSRAGSSQKKKSPFFEMLDFLRSVMDLRSTTSKISETEEEGNAEDTQQAPEEEMGFGDNQPGPEENPSSHQPGPEENLSSQSAATATLQRQRVPIRSVGATASKGSKRRGKKKHDMDGTMLTFMEEMRGMRRADTNDPFSDPNNEDATFLRSLYHHLQKVPTPRKMDVQLAIFNFTAVCIRAAMSGDPMPTVINPLQRPYHSEQAPPPTFHHPYHPGHYPPSPPCTSHHCPKCCTPTPCGTHL